jgi:glycosyltransferase involved in cell wall biosynthesis
VFVLPSRQEGLGVAALEAMARGRPVVASAVGGLAEIVVPEETGLLVAPGDPTALAAALERLQGDSELARRLGSAGAKRVAGHFLAEQMVSAYEALYREILAEAGASGRGEP